MRMRLSLCILMLQVVGASRASVESQELLTSRPFPVVECTRNLLLTYYGRKIIMKPTHSDLPQMRPNESYGGRARPSPIGMW